jgi:hypothetical protein
MCATTTNDKPLLLLLLLLLQLDAVELQHVANITVIQHNASSNCAGYLVLWFSSGEFSARNTESILCHSD